MENELVVRNASPGLRHHIRRYVGYAERTAEPTRQREPPSTGVVLIFGLGPELRLVGQTDPMRPAMRLGSFVASLDDTCAVIEHDGEMRGVQVDLTPLAARMIFRVPMQELARRVVPLEDLLGREAQRLEDRLLDSGAWNERVRPDRVRAREAACEGRASSAGRRLGLAPRDERTRQSPYR